MRGVVRRRVGWHAFSVRRFVTGVPAMSLRSIAGYLCPEEAAVGEGSDNAAVPSSPVQLTPEV